MNPILATLLPLWRSARAMVMDTAQKLAAWAAAQSWGRLAVLSLLALIAQSIVTDNLLHWHDERTVIHRHTAKHAPTADARGASDDPDVHIGWDGINVIHRPAGSAPDAATTPSAPSVTPPPASTPSTPGLNAGLVEDDAEDSDEVHTRRTLGGALSDAIEALVLLTIVFLIAAKVVMRQAARSEARAMEAEASAAAAEANAAAAAANARAAEAQAERTALRYQLAQAQLQTLQAQVEPHFLFNTLASVDFLIETDPARASTMQKNLIRYLRAALPQMRDHGSHLGREIELVRAYLEILQVRMEDRLKVVIDVPEGLRSAEFPPMLLQSLVENAIRHGLEPKAEGGEICIRATVEDGALRVQVRDTGVGPSAATGASRAPGETGGVGLRNARERLALLYPDAAECTLQANEPVGAIASIRLPYRVTSPRRDASQPASAASGDVGADAGLPGTAGV